MVIFILQLCACIFAQQNSSPVLSPLRKREHWGSSERAVPFSRVPLSGVAVFRAGSQKFVPARRLRTYTTRGSPGDGSHVSAIRVRLHPLPYIPSCRWIPGAHNGEHAKDGGRRRRERERETRVWKEWKKNMRKEKETSLCLVHPLWGIWPLWRCAWPTHEEPATSGIRCFIRKGERKRC